MYGLTQKGRTVLCEICNGVGAVLAQEVKPPIHVGQFHLDARVREGDGVLIPCPGCFNGGDQR
jgi:hypothetical protein